VFKKILQTHGQTIAEVCVADMMKGKVVEMTAPLALYAALLSAQHHLPMADSFILATAREHDAVLWTQDEHFAGLEGVRYFPRG
ncbi:MAG: PIN domain-containing protein, partial [Anaerolineales bacterium]|nr:PIN domain-containing protein [Anaerolineales bacterium]